jgi:hypothetical protein
MSREALPLNEIRMEFNHDLIDLGFSVAREMNISSNVIIEWYSYTSAKATCRLRDGAYKIRISRFYLEAPSEVVRSLVCSVLARIMRRSDRYLGVYKTYLAKPEVRERLAAYRGARGRKILRGHQGRFHNLQESFDRVNLKYYDGEISGITLTWGQDSRRTLGHYDATHRTIVVSSRFDRRTVPGFLVDFIIYHELLHHVIPTRYRNGRRIMHPPELKKRERQFDRYEEVVKLLKTIR